MMRTQLDIGCTLDRHKVIGIGNGCVNARAGLQHLNDLNIEDIEQMRDAIKVRQRIELRVRFYQFNSKSFRRNQHRLAHLLSERIE